MKNKNLWYSPRRIAISNKASVWVPYSFILKGKMCTIGKEVNTMKRKNTIPLIVAVGVLFIGCGTISVNWISDYVLEVDAGEFFAYKGIKIKDDKTIVLKERERKEYILTKKE